MAHFFPVEVTSIGSQAFDHYTQTTSKCIVYSAIDLQAFAGIHMGPAVFAAGIRTSHFQVTWVYTGLFTFTIEVGAFFGPIPVQYKTALELQIDQQTTDKSKSIAFFKQQTPSVKNIDIWQTYQVIGKLLDYLGEKTETLALTAEEINLIKTKPELMSRLPEDVRQQHGLSRGDPSLKINKNTICLNYIQI